MLAATESQTQVWSVRADDRVRGVPRLHEEGQQAEPLLPVRVQGMVLQAQDTPLDHRPHRRGVERETAQKTLTTPAKWTNKWCHFIPCLSGRADRAKRGEVPMEDQLRPQKGTIHK